MNYNKLFLDEFKQPTFEMWTHSLTLRPTTLTLLEAFKKHETF